MELRLGFLTACLMLSITGCGSNALGTEFVPLAADLQQQFPEFTLSGSTVQGVYGNLDVDSRVFICTPASDQMNAGGAIARLEKAALRSGWQVREKGRGHLRLNRFSRGALGEGGLFSAEEARIVASPDGALHIAWVQADSRSKVTRFEEAGVEAKWAESAIWTKLPPPPKSQSPESAR